MNKLSFQSVLYLFFAFIFSLIAARIYFTNSLMYGFLIWNIFLAFAPYWVSNLFIKKGYSNWLTTMLFFAWLLFFPNALYIITDLIHLQRQTIVPIWYDVIIVFSSALLGIVLAFISLFKVEEFLQVKFGNYKTQFLIPVILFLAAFGVYLGRFLRWNSWDIIQNPLGLVSSIAQRFIYPFEHLRTWGLTVILFILFYILYLGIKKLPVYLKQAV
ncbi:MAG: DUF1361 domain-containing protein [Ferruginibacter sp.]|nr:DUF1361 domain-containing protein [Ferruginibacter sp.]